ncbi:Delta(8)-fatty-acid desaturase 2 [Symbiodinium microadriaticum]|uniref:Delta(8)-fatty-acid desaturase 2 n=1 Tax=Symbiodinium microadriaticum TaxID=2951 RepID=A0A1Q9DT51_SYMMI|nr:Delta(8)-fatty-acid desaturase 2 [Symbiodinium microadriaticum]
MVGAAAGNLESDLRNRHDPDIQHMPALAVTPEIFKKPFWSTYYNELKAMDRITKFMVSYEHLFFYPNLGKTELCAFAIYFTWIGSLVLSLPTWSETLDWVHIGLQFQIEHHLFPRLPRHNLREARTLVKEVCKKHNIRYHEPGFFQALAAMLSVVLESETGKPGDSAVPVAHGEGRAQRKARRQRLLRELPVGLGCASPTDLITLRLSLAKCEAAVSIVLGADRCCGGLCSSAPPGSNVRLPPFTPLPSPPLPSPPRACVTSVLPQRVGLKAGCNSGETQAAASSAILSALVGSFFCDSMGLLRWYVLFLAFFEFPPLYKLLVEKVPLHEVTDGVSADSSNGDFTIVYAGFLLMLVTVRLVAFFAGSKPPGVVRQMLVAVHTTEIFVIAPLYLRNVQPRRKMMGMQKMLETDVVMTFVVLNPGIFALFYPVENGTAAKDKIS